jgi:phospholipid/cholesterol/gamma-HCH transport system permease protein
MTAEIGTMRISEQIDALKTLCINPFQYLITPRIVATTLILPFLSLFCSICGILTGYIVATRFLNVNPELYLKTIRENVEFSDIQNGLIKATVFGFLLSWIASYKGFTTSGGSKGVGLSTTQSVVYACVAIFITDYIMSALGY